ncbi:Membrane protein insertase YidC [Candidatus Annandia adelgestsuga]|uniref:Membrane protein insertase YidC n=1 Tax=Candidatus Annandia adelgestsuga TaxID=1302411 RepID=A0A3S9J7H9_9ENTR|nr:membrane protein insertase YidC [Candidatus Annandia adelgestsuga]AZP36234.1 Membrane protein insertase YidC [Candidatus Annandia adelgestsuga]
MINKRKNIFFLIILFFFLFISNFFYYNYNFKNNNKNYKIKNNGYIFKKNIIKIKTNVMYILINTKTGLIENIKLKNYNNKSFILSDSLKKKLNYICEFNDGVIKNDKIIKNINYNYKYNFPKFIKFKKKQNKITIMIYNNKKNIIYNKYFTFYPNKYFIDIKYNIYNISKKKVKISIFNNLKQNLKIIKNNNYYKKNFGISYYTIKEKYNKFNFKNLLNNIKEEKNTKNGWIAITQKYFLTSIIPNNKIDNIIYINNLKNKNINLGYFTKSYILSNNKYKKFETIIFIGPKIKDYMNFKFYNLNLVIDYGFLWFISKPLFVLLKSINFIFKNWGISIIIITLLLRFIIYPITKIQYIYMIKMNILKPKINSIYKNFYYNKNLLKEKIFNLYKKERINPLSSFLPLILQTPIFLSLYYMIINSAELNNTSFLWIKDLSSKDDFYILPLIMGITILIMQKISLYYIKDYQKKNILNIIPILFILFFLWLPSGLVLYYIINNIITI